MKYLKFLSLTLVLLLIITFSAYSQQSGWIWNNPLPHGNSLYGVDFINQQTGFAGGACGLIMKTTNSGLTWELKNTPTVNLINAVVFINDNTGLASGYNSVIIRTTDAGETWNLINENTGVAYFDMKFVNSTTGFICGLPGVIEKTTNAGINWFPLVSGTSSLLWGISFKDEQNGIAAGAGGMVYRTTNSGENWIAVPLPSSNTVLDIHYSGSGTVFASAIDGAVFRSTNDGVIWETINYNFDGVDLYNIFFVNGTTGFCSGEGKVFRSTNGGNNWALNSNLNVINNFDHTGDGNIFFVGVRGYMYKSTNTGASWNDLSSGNRGPNLSIDFLNQNYGMILNGIGVKITQNGGANWVYYEAGGVADFGGLQDVEIIDEQISIICGTNNALLSIALINRTTNGGINWTPQFFNGFPGFKACAFFNSSTGFIVGNSGVMMKTTDSGISWQPIPSGVSNALNSIVVSGNTGYSAGGQGTILKTTDAGETWLNISGSISESFTDIDFRGGEFVYMTTSSGNVVRTTNGGVSWELFGTGLIYPARGIAFKDDNTGWCVGDDVYGDIYKTTTSGLTWERQRTRHSGLFYDVYVIQNDKVIATGVNGVILQTTTGGNPIGIEDPAVELPEIFRLFQNYPNPFNPATNITYDIPERTDVKIAIYDIIGKELEVLLNNEVEAGRYEVIWNAAAYSSGIYFCKILTKDFTKTIKLVLVK